MHRQIALLLLLAPVLNAQQTTELRPSPSAVPVRGGPPLVLATRASYALEKSPLPDAPQPRLSPPEAEAAPAPALYQPTQTAGKAPQPPLTTPVIWNKKFIAVHAAFLGSIVYDAELTHQGLAHHDCVEANPNFGDHPGRGVIYRGNLLAFTAVTTFDWFMARAKIRYVPFIGPTVGTAVHLAAGSRWLTQCW
jgi:hypothetical protein